VKKILIGLIVLLVIVRIALPYVLKSQINRRLHANEAYPGHLNDVSLSVFKGAVLLNGLLITDKNDQSLHVQIDQMRGDISWSALLHRKVLMTFDIQHPQLRVVLPQAQEEAKKAQEAAKEEVKKQAKKPAEKSLGQTLKELPNFRIDSIALHDGRVEIIDTESKPDQHILVHAIDFQAINLTNSRAISESLYASAAANLKINSEGEGNLKMTFNPIAKEPTFSLRTQVQDVPLQDFNPYIRHQFGLVIDSGTLSLYTEDVAAKGAFQGYVKPVIKDLKVGNPSKGKPMKTLEKTAIQATTHLLSNSNKELSTSVPIEGKFEDPNTGLGVAVMNVLGNALTNSIRPTLEGRPTLKNVRKNAPEIKEKSQK
jgi:hypothetical protein